MQVGVSAKDAEGQLTYMRKTKMVEHSKLKQNLGNILNL